MVDPNMILTIKLDAGGFVDHSQKLSDLTRDDVTFTMLSGEDFYVGNGKPFGAAYCHFTNPSTTNQVMTLEVWNGTTWVTPSLVQDETQGFTRSGFIFWDKTDMVLKAVDSVSKFYIRINFGSATSAMVMRGFNLVFSDDSRLRTNFPPINSTSFYPEGESSHILTHVAVRDEIIMRLRKRYQKRNDSSDVDQMINAFDLINIFEIREAATYLCLAKTFFNIFDNEQDKWYKSYQHWKGKYEAAFETSWLSMDLDDDGIDDDVEIQAPKESARLIR